MEKQNIKKLYIDKIKNRLYGLLVEREKGGKWEKYLDTILIELSSQLNSNESINYYIIFSKLSACKYLSYKYFRKTIFECINLLDRADD